MNLLMILLIVLAMWICGAICYFAWRLMLAAEKPEPIEAAITADTSAQTSTDLSPESGADNTPDNPGPADIDRVGGDRADRRQGPSQRPRR